jgi:small subunit ribosomal protein S20
VDSLATFYWDTNCQLGCLDTYIDGPLFYSSFSRDIFPTVLGDIEVANHKSAEKRVRQTERRNEVNSRNRSHLRTQIKKLRAAIEGGNREEAKAILGQTVSVIDRSIQKGVLHHNAAARHKSRLTSKVNGMSA